MGNIFFGYRWIGLISLIFIGLSGLARAQQGTYYDGTTTFVDLSLYGFDSKYSAYAHDTRLWIPNDVTVIRGVIILGNGAGGDQRNRTEETDWQALARAHGFALMGTRGYVCYGSTALVDEEVRILLNDFVSYATASSHPEVANLPFVLAGWSGGGQMAYGINTKIPGRVIAYIMNKGSRYITDDLSADALKTPSIGVSGQIDPGRMGIINRFKANRPRGGLCALAIEQNTDHVEGNVDGVFFTFFDHAIRARYPTNVTPLSNPVTLLNLSETNGWLAAEPTTNNGLSGSVYPYAAYSGTKTNACWLMDADVANLYRGFATYNPAVTVTPVGGPLFSASQMIEFRVSVNSTAFPGWVSADVYDGAVKLGTVNKDGSMSVYAVRPWGGRGVTAIARDASGNERTSIPQPFVVNKNSAPAWNNGSGNFLWNTTSTNWGGAVWTPGADAVFGATGVGTVTVSGTQTLADSLTALCFDTAGYKLMGGPLALPAYPGISGFNVNADAEIASVITGSGNLNKTGAGTLTLTGSNTHTGTTAVKAGSLKLGNGGNLSNTWVPVFSSGTLAIGQNASGTSNGLNYLTLFTGANFTMADTFTSRVNVGGARLSSGDVNAASPILTFDIATANQTSDRLAISGEAIVETKLPTIVPNFLAAPSSGSNTYTLISAASGLGLGATNFNLAPANITIGGNPYYTSLASSTDTAVILSFVPGTMIIPYYWKGGIDGKWTSENFKLDAAGTSATTVLPNSTTSVYMTANTANNLNTTLDQAFIIIGLTFTGSGTANTAGSIIGAGSGGTLQINSGGISVNAGSGANAITAPVTLGSVQSWTNNSVNALTVGPVNNGGFLLTIAGSGNTTINGALSGTGSLTQSGSGTLNLSGSNTYTGATRINEGTLSVSTDANLGSGGGITLNGGTLKTTGSSAFSSSRAISVTGNSTIDASNTVGTTLTGLVTGGGALTKTGSGSLTFSPGVGNSDTLVGFKLTSGQVNINSGVLNITGSGWQDPTQGLWLTRGNLNVAGGALSTTGNVVNENGTLTVAGGTYTSYGWLINAWGGTATTTVSGGLLDIDGGLRVSQGIGTVNLDGGTVKLRVFQCGTVGSTGTVNFNGATVVAKANVTGFTQTLYTTYIVKSGGAIIDTAGFNITAAADLLAGSPSGGLTKNGAGTLTLSGNSTYTGATTINAGTLQLDGSVAGNLTVQAGGTLTGSGTITRNLTVASGGTTQFSGGTFTVNGGITNNGTLILSNGAQITGYSSFINNGVIINPTSAGAVTVSRSGNTVSVSIPSNTGYAYQLQYSSELSGESFTNVGAPQLGTGTTLVFTDPNATTSSGVYKVVAFITQSINFPSIPTQTYGVSPFSLGATSTSGLQISYSTTSTNLVSISGNTMTVLGAGTAMIVASQAGNSNYMAATSVTNQLVISKATQTISPFVIIPTQTYATNMTMIITPPTANSSQPVSVKVLSGPATMSGNTLTLTGTGTVVLAADQSGNENYLAAPEITTSFTVAPAATPVNVNVFFMDGSTVIRKRH